MKEREKVGERIRKNEVKRDIDREIEKQQTAEASESGGHGYVGVWQQKHAIIWQPRLMVAPCVSITTQTQDSQHRGPAPCLTPMPSAL